MFGLLVYNQGVHSSYGAAFSISIQYGPFFFINFKFLSLQDNHQVAILPLGLHLSHNLKLDLVSGQILLYDFRGIMMVVFPAMLKLH